MELNFSWIVTRTIYRGLYAGDLVDHLYELQIAPDDGVEFQLDSDEDDIPEAVQKAEAREKNKAEIAALLYSKTCLHCHAKDRNVVTLPCSHLTLCLSCVPSVTVCPRDDCNMSIETTVNVYMV